MLGIDDLFVTEWSSTEKDHKLRAYSDVLKANLNNVSISREN